MRKFAPRTMAAFSFSMTKNAVHVVNSNFNLFRAMKSRTKNEDQEKLKAKGKELQRLEEEQQRYEQANNTAIMAIGGPRKMLKLDGPAMSSASGGAMGSSMGSTSSKPRTKRVHVRDLVFLMEQEKDLKRSPLLWKAYCS